MGPVFDNKRPDLGGNVRHGDIYTWCPVLWSHLIDRFAVKSILDVGCGEGHAVAYFERQGVKAHGIEGLAKNIHRAVTPIALHDISMSAYVMPVDLVWSCEVAEHIIPEKVDNYIDTLVNGKVIAMTHALPGQGGHHHVNCQPKEYWVELISKRGYFLSPHNNLFIEISKKEYVPTYFSKSGLVFLRE
jgi:SAM-dependent methyltransferase